METPGLMKVSDPASPPAANPSQSADPAAPSDGLPKGTTRPDGLPDQYWDEKAGGIQLKPLIADLTNLSKFKADQDKVLGEVPKTADGYKLPDDLIPEDLAKQLPAGAELTLDEESPLLLGARSVLHKHQASPALFSELGKLVVAEQVKAHIASEKAHADFIAAEDAKLGGNAAARKTAVADFLKGHLGEEGAKAFSFDGPNRNATAAQIEALENLAKKFSNQGNVVPLHQKRDETPAPAPAKPLMDRLADQMYPNANQKAG